VFGIIRDAIKLIPEGQIVTDKDISVTLEKRTVVRKGLKGLRSEGKVPAVIHNHGSDSMHVVGEYRPLVKVFNEAGKHHPVEVVVDGKKHLALIKEADFEPVKHILRHVVFQAIRRDEKATADIPVVLAGGDDIPALKRSLIILSHADTIQVEALPKDLPDTLEADATVLAEEGDRLTVADLKVPAGVTILTDPEHVIATVETPKDQIAEANASAADLAADAGQTETAAEPAADAASEKEDK
jgi:large subunit ribosomal protein L25